MAANGAGQLYLYASLIASKPRRLKCRFHAEDFGPCENILTVVRRPNSLAILRARLSICLVVCPIRVSNSKPKMHIKKQNWSESLL